MPQFKDDVLAGFLVGVFFTSGSLSFLFSVPSITASLKRIAVALEALADSRAAKERQP